MIRARTPSAAEVPAVLSMLTRAYVAARPDFPDDPAVLGRYSDHDPAGGAENWVAMWDGDRPVSALRLFYRSVEAGDDVAMQIAGIGNVGTDPEYGGRGLGVAVMSAAHDRIAEAGIPAALLVTDIPGFYARLGYAVVSQPEIVVTLDPARLERRVDPAVHQLDAGEASPEWVQERHAAVARAVTGRVRRDPAYWTRWIDGFRAAPPIERWIAPNAGYLIGRSEEDGDAFRILEAAGETDAIIALIVAARGHARRIKAPDDAICRASLEAVASAVAPRTRGGIMARPTDRADGPAPDVFGGYLELDTF